MSENNTNAATETTESNETISQLARNLIAEHPWFTGLAVTAVASALSHFYYGNKLLTTAAWAFAGLVGGVALSKIAAHAKEIEIAAQAAVALPAEMIAVGAYLEGALRKQASMLRDLQQENEVLKATIVAEGQKAEAHRQWAVAQTEEAKAFANKASEDFAKAIAVAQQAQVIEVPAPVAVEAPVAGTPAAKPAKAPKAA